MNKDSKAVTGGIPAETGCGCTATSAAADAGKTAAPGCCGSDHDHDAAKAGVRDPVCGMIVDPATSPHRFDYHGKTSHFCSAGCRTKFAANPQTYLDNNS